MVDPSEALVTSTLILLSPIILALPLSVGWKWWVGSEPEHEHYMEKVRRVLDAGIPLRRYRAELDAEARRFLIDPERQARIESDILHPLRIQHFILLPSLIVWPVLGLFAAVIAIPLMPVLRVIEWIMIDKRALAKSAKVLQSFTRWEVIGIPRLDDGAKQLDKVLTSVHRLPITVFLGLFTYLVVLYLPLEARDILLVSGAVYIVLVSITSILRAATANALVFADPTKRRLIPMDTFVEDALGPLVGVGLVFLITRQLIYDSQLRSNELFGDPVVFSLSVLLVLYTATIIGVTVELSFFRFRGKEVRKAFQEQMVEEYDPTVYLFTRNMGTLRLSPLMPLSEWLNKGEVFEFDSVESE
ncbi:uncharacterized protein METZ01_LOCUS161801 [marine metagenome]|uniref:Uncharacterized protein n=1 Tax=marine metagenome TaxID=408172 RepID=A0A382B6R8_9ZZZZ